MPAPHSLLKSASALTAKVVPFVHILPSVLANAPIPGMWFMVQAIGKMPGPTQIVIRSVEANGAVRIAKAEFHYLPERVSVRTFRFDANGNLLSCDLFSLARG